MARGGSERRPWTLLPLLLLLVVVLCPQITFGQGWTQLATFTNTRFDCSAVYRSSSNEVFVWGGKGGNPAQEASTNVPVNTMLRYSVADDTWFTVTQTGAPSSRHSHTAVLSSNQTMMLLFGGTNDVTYYGQLYLFHFDTNTWTLLSPQGIAPSARALHSAVMTSVDTMIVFGGQSQVAPAYRNDMFKYDLSTNTWTQLEANQPTALTKPSPRWDSSMVLTSANTLIVFGGLSNTLYVNDIWGYDLVTKTWEEYAPSGAISSRASHRAVARLTGEMVVFGGVTGVYLNDLHSFSGSSSSNSWLPLTAATSPSGRRGSGAIYIPTTDQLMIFGGRSESLSSNQLWSYSFTREPLQLFYAVEETPTEFVITFKLKQVDTFAGNVESIVIGDSGSGSSSDSMVLDNPTVTQTPPELPTSGSTTGVHAGVTLSGTWSPAGIGSFITWKITVDTFPLANSLYWSSLAPGYTINYLRGINNCYEGDIDSDKDSDLFSYCNAFDLSYFDCNDNNVLVNPSQEELCNLVDDNCDGLVDNDIMNPPPLLPNTGECGNYSRSCQAGIWIDDYTVVPTYESPEVSCDGKDNDCDGDIDNVISFPLADKQSGVCAGTLKICGGVDGFEEPDYSTVVGYELPEFSCDGSDNDCDPLTPESDLVGPLLGNQDGVCQGARQTCQGGGWVEDYSVIDNYSSPEGLACDGLDSDCDTEIDNGLTPPLASVQYGVCSGQVQVCAGVNGWIEPDFSVTVPTYENPEVSCDNLDNDCDDSVDENLVGALLSNQTGVCQGNTAVCQNGSWVEDYASIPGFSDPEGLQCNGLDSNCDGEIDNGLTPPLADKQDGVCAGSVKECAGIAGWEEPDYSTIPAYQYSESECDGLDNDCDGDVDTLPSFLLPLQDGVCFGYFQICIAGAGVADYGIVPGYEAVEVSCDGLDNDCDGVVDGMLGNSSNNQEGVCLGAAQICEDGAYVDRYDLNPNYEAVEATCDGLDNDCDGSIDLSLTPIPASLNAGVCAGLVQSCINGSWEDPDFSQVQFYEENDETLCDGRDNNCDGIVDDDIAVDGPLNSIQFGVCNGTRQRCIAGEWSDVYDAPEYSAVEICDGLDNDCNGEIDEGLTPPLADNQNRICNGSVKICAGVDGWVNPDPRDLPGWESDRFCDGTDFNCRVLTRTCQNVTTTQGTATTTTSTLPTFSLPDLPGIDSSDTTTVFGMELATEYLAFIVIAILLVVVTFCASVAYVFCGKKKRPRRPPMPYGMDGMPPLPPGYMEGYPEDSDEEMNLDMEPIAHPGSAR